MIFGRNAVREALRGRRTVERVWASGRTADEPWLAGAPLERVDDPELTRICGSTEHQHVCARVSAYRYADPDDVLSAAEPLIVALDRVQDPHNLGAICRTAECAGATGVVVPRHRAAEVTPAVCRASSGAVEHLAVAQVRNLADFLADAKRADCWIYGAAAEGGVPYDRPDYRGGVVLVLGAEGRGLGRRVAGACDALVSLPLHGRIESLNVSAAAAVLMYEVLQARARG